MEDIVIKKASYRDKDIIRNMIIELDVYYYNNFNNFKKSIYSFNEYVKMSSMFIDKVDIECFYILYLNNKPIGCIMVWDNKGETTLINFFIHNKYRRNGYGSILMDYIMEHTKTLYCVLCTLSENKKAINFYNRYGFKYIQKERMEGFDLLWFRYDKI